MVESKEQLITTSRVESNEKWKLYDFVDQNIKSRISNGERIVKEKEVVEISKIVSRLEKKHGPELLDLVKVLLDETKNSVSDIKSVLESVFDELGEKGYISKLAQNVNEENQGKVKEFLLKKYSKYIKINKDKDEINKDKDEINKDKDEIASNLVELKVIGQSLKESANRFYDKYKKEFQAKNYDERLEKMNSSLAAQGLDEMKLGMSIGEYATLMVTMEVMGEIHKEGKLSSQDAQEYEKFVGEYDKYSNLLGVKSNLTNYTKDNSVYYNNPSVRDYISSEPKTKLNLDGVDEKLIKQFGVGEQSLEQGTQFISSMFKLNGNKQVFNNYMDMLSDKFSRLNGNNANSDKIGEINIDPKGKQTPEFQMSYNLDGYDLEMKIDEKGTVFMTDLLGKGKGSIGVNLSTIDDILPPNELVKIPTLGEYENALGMINFSSLIDEIKFDLKQPKDELDVQHNEQILLNAFNRQLQIQFDKKNPKGKGESYSDEQLNNVIVDQQVSGFLVNMYPDQSKVEQYKIGAALSEQQNPDMFKYLTLMRNTLDFQTTAEKSTTKELFQNIKNTLNDPTIHNNPNFAYLKSLFPSDNNCDTKDFNKIIDSFTDFKGGEKVIEIAKLEKFYNSILKNNKREIKLDNEENENPDDLLSSLSY